VIPADDPLWRQLDGLLDHPVGYGEASWDDVRMRVIGHVATIGRDRARSRAIRGDFGGCAEAYRDTAARLDTIRSSSTSGGPIRVALRDAAARDGALCDALARGEEPPDPGSGIASLRARWHALARRASNGDTVTTEAAALALEARAVPAPTLDLDGFADFEARHALRVKLVQAYADAVDPLRPSEPWGYWEPAEVVRVATAIAAASEALAAGEPVELARLTPTPAPVVFTAEALGALPTGDSLVDVVGFPGPRAIGSLAVLSLEDPAHRAWLEARAEELNGTADAGIPDAIAAMVTTLDAHAHGSRYYNIKQARNAAIRVLASRGAYAEARVVVQANLPLHAQDWACPDRAAIVGAIEGRLLVAAGDPQADAVLDAALADADRFLAHTTAREAAGPVGPPPGRPSGAMGPPPGAPGGPGQPAGAP
jgi:hypothetical protein